MREIYYQVAVCFTPRARDVLAVSSGIRAVCRVAVCVLSSKETDKCDILDGTLSSNNYMNDGAITLYV